MEKFKIIQSLNTFNNDPGRLHPGFSTIREMQKFMKQSYEIHKYKNFVLYTDQHGANMLDFMHDNIELFNFKQIDDRIPYIGKFQVQDIQDNPYIHIDLDSYILKTPSTTSDVLCEKIRI